MNKPKNRVRLDAISNSYLLNRYLAFTTFTKFDDSKPNHKDRKILYKKGSYEIQWKNIWSDIKGVAKLDFRLIPKIAYSIVAFGFMFLGKHEEAIAFIGAVGFDAGTAGSGIDTSISFAHTCTGTDLVLTVGFTGRNSALDDVTGMTYNSAALTKIGSNQNGGTPNFETEIWKLTGPATGSNTVVVSGVTSGESHAATAVSFTGSDGTVDGYAGDSSTGATSASVAITSAVGNMVVDVFGIAYNAEAETVGADQTTRASAENVGPGELDAYASTETGGASVTMSWSWATSRAYCHGACNITAGSQPVTGSHFLLMGL